MTPRVLLGCSATLASAWDFGFMALAAPAIDADLDLGAAYPWLFSAGSFAYGAVVLPAGAQAGRIAPARLLGAGLLLSALGATVLACAAGVAGALAGRVLFGLGGGIAASPALAIMAEIEECDARRAGFARLGAAVAAGFTLGVLLGSLVVALAGWRLVLAASAAALGALAWQSRRLQSPSARHHGTTSAGRVGAPIGSPGAGLFGAGTVAATAGLAWAERTPRAAAIALGSAALLWCAGWRRACTWLPRARGAALIACCMAAATTASGVGATVLLGRSLAAATGASAAVTGLVLSAFGVAVLPATALAHGLAARLEPILSAGVGLGLQAVAIALLAGALAVAHDALLLAAPVALFGAGHVVANAGLADAVTGLAARRAAPVGGLLITAQFVGGGAGALIVLGAAARRGSIAGLLVAAGIACAGTALGVSATRLASARAARRRQRSPRPRGPARDSTVPRGCAGDG